MPISRTTFLSKPKSGERVAPETFSYIEARAKRHAYNLVIKEFKRSGITKAELARRFGKGADRISRMLGGPGNWTLSTAAGLLFAISGAALKFDLEYPLDLARRNDTKPGWLKPRDVLVKKKIAEAAITANTANRATVSTATIWQPHVEESCVTL